MLTNNYVKEILRMAFGNIQANSHTSHRRSLRHDNPCRSRGGRRNGGLYLASSGPTNGRKALLNTLEKSRRHRLVYEHTMYGIQPHISTKEVTRQLSRRPGLSAHTKPRTIRS